VNSCIHTTSRGAPSACRRSSYRDAILRDAAYELFSHHILRTDESCFTRESVFSVHNSQLWARDNLHAIHFSLSVRAEIVEVTVMSPCLLPERLTIQRCRDFLESALLGAACEAEVVQQTTEQRPLLGSRFLISDN
jgi:hypothetical protein